MAPEIKPLPWLENKGGGKHKLTGLTACDMHGQGGTILRQFLTINGVQDIFGSYTGWGKDLDKLCRGVTIA